MSEEKKEEEGGFFATLIGLVAVCGIVYFGWGFIQKYFADDPYEEVIARTLSSPVYSDYDPSEYANCFSQGACTEVKEEQLEEKISGKYIVVEQKLDGISSTDNPNKFKIDTCVTTRMDDCTSTYDMAKWSQKLGPLAFPCMFRGSLWVTDEQIPFVTSLEKGSDIKIKGEVMGVMGTMKKCSIRLSDIILVK